MSGQRLQKKSSWLFFLLLTAHYLTVSLLFGAQPADLEDEAQKIASELRCPVCQNLSAADSPSEMAQEMRGLILDHLKQGRTPEQIKDYFVSKYGEWVLLAPKPKGFSLVLWTGPYAAAGAGIILVFFLMRRWVKKKSASTRASELTSSALPEEQAGLSAELEEIDFDFHSGRLSEADYKEIRRELEDQAAAIQKKIESQPSPALSERHAIHSAGAAPTRSANAGRGGAHRRNWQLVAGGLFLLLFGITLGVYLSKSLRPRASEQDTMTGDFLTGTGPGGVGASSENDLGSFLARGRASFARQEWPQAIDAFKNALAIDPNHSEAHTYMGFILAQAGHAEGALLAFDRALSSDANFPPALWGKGMLLYRVKEDLPAARQTLEKLVSIMQPGPEREEVQKTVAELSQLTGKEKKALSKARANAGSTLIRGAVSIDPKLKKQLDSQAVLFIIARPASSSGGPPLAVKRVEQPSFPVSYSLGPENVMIPGTSFTGKVAISARLDKDGNPTTKEPGNLTGEYKKNPVEVGADKIDIVLDQIM